MSLVKILDVNVHFLRIVANNEFMDELSHQIESKLATLGNMKESPYDRQEIMQLISSIESDKARFLRGKLSAQQLYRDVSHTISLFKIKHPGFDYMNDPAINAYFS